MTAELDIHDGVAILRLNRPQSGNAIDPATAELIADHVTRIEADPTIVVAIITGTGERTFCAGSDLKARAAGRARTVEGYGYVHRKRAKPYIAAVNGKAIGGGFEIMLASDMAVGVRHATFSLPEVAHGVLPAGGGLTRLGRLLPPAIVRELVVAGRTLSAAEAERWGLLNRVVDQPEDLLPAALELADRIRAGAPLSIRESLSVLRVAAGDADEVLLSRAQAAKDAILASPDSLEGPRAFAEGRTPSWQESWSAWR